jgi:hypothetical protein
VPVCCTMSKEREQSIFSLGPFEVAARSSECEPVESALVRNLDCKNYCTCLNLAVSLNWESFTCEGCSGELNEALKWRAGQHARQDAVTRALCPKPGIRLFKSKPSP